MLLACDVTVVAQMVPQSIDPLYASALPDVETFLMDRA